jgi:glucokinase
MTATGKNFAIGIDLGGTNMRIALVSRDGQLIRKIKEPTSGEIVDMLLKSVSELFSDDIAGICIGIAGLIDREQGKILVSPNLHAVEAIDFVAAFEKKFGVPVFLENDANTAALRVSSEIGHMSIDITGKKCPCGNFGCLETYASARALLSKAISFLEDGRESLLTEYCGGTFYKLTAEDINRAALDGDNLARELLKDTGRYLGIGIANIINIMSPEAIILSGGLIGAWDIYIQEAIKEASRRSLKELFDMVRIVPSSLLDNAGIIGAAGLVFQLLAEGDR